MSLLALTNKVGDIEGAEGAETPILKVGEQSPRLHNTILTLMYVSCALWLNLLESVAIVYSFPEP